MSGHILGSRLGFAAFLLAVLGGAVPAAPPAAAQSLGRLERERGLTMLRLVRDDVEKHYYDPTYRGIDLAVRFDGAERQVRAATTPAEMLGSIANVLFALDDSHTFFVPPGLTIRVDYGWEMQFYGDSCFVTEVRPESDARKRGLRPGDRVVAVNGVQPTRANLWQMEYVYHVLRPQRTLRVVVQSPGGAPRQLDLEARARERYRVLDLTQSSDVWDLIREEEDAELRYRPRYATPGPDLLIWKLPLFTMGAVEDGWKQMHDRKTVILDLRGSKGGSEASLLELIGRLSAEDVAVGTLARRSGEESLTAKGHGKDAFAGQLVVLVDSRSASAAEIFARTMQLKGRARVIGDRTAGAVMRSRGFGHATGTQTIIPFGTSVTDADVILADGSRLEKAGVLPDVRLVPAAADLAAQRDPVLSRAAQLVGMTLTPEEAWRLLQAD